MSSIIASLIFGIYSLGIKDLYRSSALLSISENSNNPARSSGFSIPGLAAFGINDNQAVRELEALAIIESYAFFENNILPNIYVPDLIYADSWDKQSRKLNYKGFNSYNDEKKLGNFERNYGSSQSLHRKFLNDHLLVSKEDSFYRVSVKHLSPNIAYNWTNLVIEEINTYFSLKDKKEATHSIEYLNNQITSTSLTELKQVFSELIKNETQKLLLIERSDQYVFDTLDPALVEDHKFQPRRSLYVLLGFIVGFFISSMYSIYLYFRNNKPELDKT